MSVYQGLGTLTRLSDAASETLSLTDLRDHLRITEVDDNDVLLLLITAVRRATETHLGRTLVDSSWSMELDKFPTNLQTIWLRMGPISVIDSVKYYDGDNALQTVPPADYEFDAGGRLRPVSTKLWPATYNRLHAVIVTYHAGEVHAGDVDEDIKLAMKLMIGHYEKSREETSFAQVNTIPLGYQYLLNPFMNYGI